jgi:hypothetical protein
MPDIEALMQGWTPEFEEMLKEVRSESKTEKKMLKCCKYHFYFFQR